MINLYITSYSLISRYVSVYHGREDHCRGASPLHRKMNHGQCVTNMSLALPSDSNGDDPACPACHH